MTRKRIIGLAIAAALAGGGVYAFTGTANASDGATAEVTAAAADVVGPVMTVYKSPTCGCCSKWIDHVEEGGIPVEVQDVGWDGLDQRLTENGIGRELRSCHLGVVDGYMVIGHVPVDVIQRLLAERPDVAGISVPGMPIGSPGMEQGDQKDPYSVMAFTKNGRSFEYERR